MKTPKEYDHVRKWAEFVRDNGDWKRIHSQFIDAQFGKHRDFIERLKKLPDWKQKVAKLYGIQNKRILEKL